MAMLKVGRIIQLSSTWRLVKTSKLLAVRVLALNTWVLWQKETLRLWVQIFLLHPHAHSVAIRWWYCHTYDDHDMVCSPSPNLYCIILIGPRCDQSLPMSMTCSWPCWKSKMLFNMQLCNHAKGEICICRIIFNPSRKWDPSSSQTCDLLLHISSICDRWICKIWNTCFTSANIVMWGVFV